MLDYTIAKNSTYKKYGNYGNNPPAFRGAVNSAVDSCGTIPAQQPDTVSFSSNNQTQKETKKQGLSAGAKISIGAAVLLGLGALVYFLTKGKGSPKVKPEEIADNTPKLEELKKQAKELKDKIREEVCKRLNEQTGFNYGKSPSDRDAYKNLKADKQQMQQLLEKSESVVREFSTKVRNSVKALQNDPEGRELLELRRQFRKEFANGNFENGGRLDLLNEILYTKLNGGQKTPYFNKLGLSVEEAIAIIKDKSLVSHKDLHQKITQNLSKEEKQYLAYMQKASNGFDLYLTNLYQDGENTKYVYNNLKRAKKYFDEKIAEVTKQKIRDARVNIAQEIRKSEDVKALKKLNEEIAKLKSQTTT